MFYSAKFWDRISDKYSKQPIADDASYQKKLSVTQTYFTPESKVLEFGCGTGTTAVTHAPFVKHILGLDLSPKMVSIARSRAKEAGADNLSFEAAIIDDYPLEANHYDVVMGMSILHLVENRHDIMKRVYATLKPGGVFVSSTVCLGPTMWWMKPVFPIGKFFGLLPMVSIFSSDQLQQDLSKAGFNPDYKFIHAKGKACFLIVRKPA